MSGPSSSDTYASPEAPKTCRTCSIVYDGTRGCPLCATVQTLRRTVEQLEGLARVVRERAEIEQERARG